MFHVLNTMFNTGVGMFSGLCGAYDAGSTPIGEELDSNGESRLIYERDELGQIVNSGNFARGLFKVQHESFNILIASLFTAVLTECVASTSRIGNISRFKRVPVQTGLVALIVYIYGCDRGDKTIRVPYRRLPL